MGNTLLKICPCSLSISLISLVNGRALFSSNCDKAIFAGILSTEHTAGSVYTSALLVLLSHLHRFRSSSPIPDSHIFFIKIFASTIISDDHCNGSHMAAIFDSFVNFQVYRMPWSSTVNSGPRSCKEAPDRYSLYYLS